MSIDRLIDQLHLPRDRYSSHRKNDGRLVAWECMKQNLHEVKSPKSTTTAAAYLEVFWDWESSHYIRGKLARNPDSIGQQYARANKSWIKRYILPHLGQKTLADIRTADIETILLGLADSKHLAPRTLNLILQAVSIPFSEAVRTGLIEKDPTMAIHKFGVPRIEKGILTEEEVGRLLGLHWDSPLHYHGFLVALFGGLRIGEILALRRESIGPDHVLVAHSFSKVVGLKSTKTNRERKVPLPAFILQGLLDLVKGNPHGEDWVFYQARNIGRPMSDKSMEEGFYASLEAIGIPDDRSSTPAPGSRKDRNITFHSLRHWCNATLRGALPDEKLRLLTGHASTEMSNHYDHATENDLLTIKKAQEQRILSLHPDKTLLTKHSDLPGAPSVPAGLSTIQQEPDGHSDQTSPHFGGR